MIWGLTASTFTLVHVVLSLAGIAFGLIAAIGMLGSHKPGLWTALFLATTILTSVTGFGFPFDHFLPSHWVGVISLVALAIAVLGLYVFHLAGAWRVLYVVFATLALYLNSFVGVVQAFQKVPFLHVLAPTQSEPPFVVAQVIVLAIFIGLGVLAAVRFRPVSA